MMLRLTCLAVLVTLGCSALVSSVAKLKSGNWGHLSFVINPAKCYSTYLNKYNMYHLYTASCHPDVTFHSDSMDWRYDTNTHQLQNRGLSKTFGKPYCLAAELLSKHAKLYVVPCKGNNHFKFLIRDEYRGSAFQFVVEADQRYCVEFHGSYVKYTTKHHHAYGYGMLYECYTISTSSEQWSNFYERSKYTGLPLQPTHDPNFAHGHWGFLKVRATGMCLAVEAVHLKMVQRVCYDSDDSEKFRYVPSTGEIQNWKYPETIGGKGCVTRNGNSQLYVTRCTGSSLQKFLIKDGLMFTGVYQQIQLYSEQRYCLYVYGSSSNGKVYPRTCHKSITSTSTQFFEFLFWRSAVECPAGKIPHGNGCKNCPAGTFNPTAGSQSCQTCRAGTTSKAGATSCYVINKCSAGTFVNGNRCTKCPINTFSNKANAQTCTSCPRAYFTKAAGSTACIKKTFCGPGKFHNGHICQKCHKNTFSDSVGNTECTPCPHGYETKSTGATRCSRKNNCQAGSFFSEVENNCVLCAKNTFTDRPHQVACTKCPAGTGTKTTGSTGCVKVNYCKAGKFHDGKKCVDCPKDSFTDEVGSWECTKCPFGQMTDRKGSTSCRSIVANDCGPGSSFNGKVCKDCPKDTYTDRRGMKYCKKCAHGYETESAGSKVCKKKRKIIVSAKTAAATVECRRNVAKPACLLQCNFHTNTGVKITYKANVSFYKLVGTTWRSIGPVAYNAGRNWFSVKVADRPASSDAGIYKCEGRYGGSSGFVRMEVVLN